MTDLERAKKIVTKLTGFPAVHLADKSHEEQRASRQACCWGGVCVEGDIEVSVCTPSAQHKGDPRTAFFTFIKLGKP